MEHVSATHSPTRGQLELQFFKLTNRELAQWSAETLGLPTTEPPSWNKQPGTGVHPAADTLQSDTAVVCSSASPRHGPGLWWLADWTGGGYTDYWRPEWWRVPTGCLVSCHVADQIHGLERTEELSLWLKHHRNTGVGLSKYHNGTVSQKEAKYQRKHDLVKRELWADSFSHVKKQDKHLETWGMTN